MIVGFTDSSLPPTTITSASPSWMYLSPSPIDEAPVEQAVADVLEGPIKLYLMEILAVGILLRTCNIVKRLIFSYPPFAPTFTKLAANPGILLPKTPIFTPVLSFSSLDSGNQSKE